MIVWQVMATAPFRPPYGRSAFTRVVFVPLGYNGAGPPRPVITRDGDILKFGGFDRNESSLATTCSWPRPTGYGLCSPWMWRYHYGRIVWRDDLFPATERAKLESEIARVRSEIAAAVPYRFSTPDPVPPGYVAAYAQGEGTMTFVSVPGMVADAGCVMLPVVFVLGMTSLGRGWSVLRRLNSLSHPKCPTCAYSLEGLQTGQCPECGTVFGDR